jgi:hypothetical protein
MTTEPKFAPNTPAKEAPTQAGKDSEAKPIVSPAPVTAPPADAKKT